MKKQQACLIVFEVEDIIKVFSRWEFEDGCEATLRKTSSLILRNWLRSFWKSFKVFSKLKFEDGHCKWHSDNKILIPPGVRIELLATIQRAENFD